MGNNSVVDTEKKVNMFVLVAYFISLALFVALRICGAYGVFGFLGTYGSYFLSLFTQIGIIFLVPLTVFTIVTRSKVKDVAKFCMFKKVSVKVLLISFVLGLLVFILNNYFSTFFNTIIQFFGYKPTGASSQIPATWWTLILDIICTAVLPAFAEEVLHRGMLLNGVSMMGMKKSILISGALFGLFHLNIEQCFYAMIIGFFLAYLCYLCSSIYPCMIVHFMNNALSVVLSFARRKGFAFGNIFGYLKNIFANNALLGTVIYILIFILVLMLVGAVIRFIMKEIFRTNYAQHQKEYAHQLIRDNYFSDIENIKNDKPMQCSGKFQGVFAVEFKDLFDFIEKNKDEIQKVAQEDFDKFKMDIRAKILLWGSFALSIIITIMTFIWGLLR